MSPSKETVVTIATQCIKKAKATRAKKPGSAKAGKKTDTAQPDDKPAWPGGVYNTVVVNQVVVTNSPESQVTDHLTNTRASADIGARPGKAKKAARRPRGGAGGGERPGLWAGPRQCG